MSNKYLDKTGLSYLVNKLKSILAHNDLSNVDNSTFKQKSTDSGAGTTPVVVATGDGTAYTATVPGITSLTAGTQIIIVPDTVSASTTPTLNVNGLGAVGIRQRLSLNTSAVVPGSLNTWLGANKPALVTYDGTYWVLEVSRASASNIYGNVPASQVSISDPLATALGSTKKTVEDALSKLSLKLKVVQVSGTTDMYGKLSWPDSTLYPICSLSRSYLICGDSGGIRVINVDTDTAVLHKNKSVSFNAIAIKKSFVSK